MDRKSPGNRAPWQLCLSAGNARWSPKQCRRGGGRANPGRRIIG